MNKLSRALISGSALSAASLLNLLLEQPVLAAHKSAERTNLPQSFSSNPALFICNNCAGNDRLASFQRLSATRKSTVSKSQDPLELNFTDEESDAAVAKFGCDCARSINMLRQTRGIKVGVEGEYLPPTQKINPCNNVNSLGGNSSFR
jgi:hypothetical protein